jgi:hypothetical protein
MKKKLDREEKKNLKEMEFAVEDMADLYRILGISIKNEYAEELNKFFNRKIKEYLSKNKTNKKE